MSSVELTAAGLPTAQPFLALERISKRFPGVQALQDVTVAIGRGSCHALIGENGAGKSTLGKIVAGLYRPDEGEIRLEGHPVKFHTPLDAVRAGITMVHQELLFCENLTVAENLSLGEIPLRGLFVDQQEMIRRADLWLSAIATGIDPRHRLGELPVSKQQLVQIAGAIGRGAKVLIFDEPTSSLSQAEATRLMEIVHDLMGQGVTCIYVSHRLEEIFELCDTITVLRDGRLVDTCAASEIDRDGLVRKMIGRDLDTTPLVHGAPAEPALTVTALSSPGKFEDVSFELRKGEILGIAGLVGAGRTELTEAIFGLDPLSTGEIVVNGKIGSAKSPAQAMRSGIGLVPEDRKRHGLVLAMTAKQNISLPTLGALTTLGFVRDRSERAVAQKYFDAMSVRAPGIDAQTSGLSGGNQQKLVLAKWLASDCDVLIVDEPTRGVDVGAKAEIHALIARLTEQGKAVLLVSSELPELLTLSSRILVLRQGRLAGEVPRAEATEETIMRLMAGVEY